MSQRIGILVDRRVLRRALGGRPTIERISLYPSVAAELGIDIVVFAIEDVHARRRTLKGYVPTLPRMAHVPRPHSFGGAQACPLSGKCAAHQTAQPS